jgi:protein TonB
VQPKYTDFARRTGIEGQVWLEVEVLKNGKVGAVEVKKSLLSGPGGLDEAAIKAVKQWEYSPAKSGGKPVACWITFPITFELK